jgi:CHAT domain-containing protein/Tfp pilus assembly protein PilF
MTLTEYYNQALSIRRSVGDRSGEATTLNNIGVVYSDLGEKTKALEYYNQTLLILRAVGDRLGEVTTLNNIGMVYSDLGKKIKALEYFNQALPIWQAVGDRSGEATTLNNIGWVYSDLGEKTKALEYYNQALPILRAVGNRSGEATTLNNIGWVYSNLGEKTKALEYYNQALPILRSVGDRSGEASALTNIGMVYSNLGKKTKALEYYNQALPILRSVGDRSGEAITLTNIGVVYSDLDEKTKALEYYNQALPILQVVGDRSGEAATLNNIGLVSSDLGEKTKALEYYNQALPILRVVGNRSGEAITFGNLAGLYRTQNQLTEALQNINAAIAIIESLRSELKNDALKTSYFASVQNYYQLKTNILMQLHQQQPTQGFDAQALETIDQSRARVLRELLIQSKANITTNINPELLAQEKALNQTLDTKEIQLVQLSASKQETDPKITQLKQEIAALYTDRDTLKNTIRATNPAYANLQYPKPTKLAELQRQLDRDTLMLQYSLGEKESYLWVISHKDLHTYILPKRSDIEKTAQPFRDAISVNPNEPKLDPITTQELFTTSQALTQQILTPAAALLGNKRLVIIPDGKLHQIPFAALTSPNSKTYQPLITQQEITNLPSASTIGILRSTVAKKPRGTKTIAILADPIFETNDDRLTGKTIVPTLNLNLDIPNQTIKSRSKRGEWKRIENTAIEAKGILGLVPQESDRTAAFGFDANYNWITAPSLSQYRYIHLATHGFFDEEKPALSSLLLSSFNAQGQTQKSYLRLPELFNLNLPSEMIVLSACETGLGKDVPGEGLMGMTRGFMYAGALRVAVSLWKVDDAATAQLMQQLYQSLWRSKKSHAASLREAQLKLWNEGTHPYYWSAFTLQGEWLN